MIHSRIACSAMLTFALAACSGAVNEAAAGITYNARYAGPAALRGLAIPAGASTAPFTATMTLSQLGSTVTGTIDVVTAPPSPPDTVLAAGVTGHTTPDGLDLIVVQPLGCAVHLSGPLTLEANGALVGSFTGGNCDAAGASNVDLDLTLTRQ